MSGIEIDGSPRVLSPKNELDIVRFTYPLPGPHGWTSIPVMQWLWGRLWDDDVLHMLTALRPSVVEVITGLETCDAVTWRVRVYVTEKMGGHVIDEIRQSVSVALPDGVKHGAGMTERMRIPREGGR